MARYPRPLERDAHLVAGSGPRGSEATSRGDRLLDAFSVLLRRLFGETELAVTLHDRTVTRRIRLAATAEGDRTQHEQVSGGDGARAPRFRMWLDADASPSPEGVDLGLEVRLSGDAPQLRWIRGTARFSERRVQIIAEQFEHLLAQQRASAATAMDELSLVPPAHVPRLPDLRRILTKPQCPSIPGATLAWARRTPDAPALVFGDRVCTYAELAERATAIAGALRARSGDDRAAVALRGRPSPGLVIAFLGVLMSGRVLVPIDLRLPAARRDPMLHAARVRDVVDVGDLRLGAIAGIRSLVVDDDGRTEASGGEPPLPEELERDGPAYVIYTSGTTGTPKGILGTRQGIAHLVGWIRDGFDVGPGDRFAHVTGIAFDAVFRDVFVPLTCGATLVIPTERALAEPLDFLRSSRITVLNSVPSRVEHWLRQGRLGARLTHLRYSLFGGESLTAELVRRWRMIAPDTEVFNFYGPTETTIIKCSYRVPEPVEPGVQPIGMPLPNTQALIVGPDLRPCGIGEVGEIALRTPFRALGYLDAPDLMQARFIVNPQGSDPEDLVYRTGDRGRLREDGCIEILGRMDHQVKIRGMRIELADIEATLRRHPEVLQAVVVATEGSTLDRMLVAFVVLAGTPASVDALRPFLAERLPAWMLPSAYLVVDEIPLDANGKIDRRALLRAYEQPSSDGGGSHETPGASEALVIRHVRELLGVERIEPDSDFFALGGDSQSAARLVSRLQRDAGVALPLRVPFETPVLREIARALDVLVASSRARDLALLDHLGDPSTTPPTETERFVL